MPFEPLTPEQCRVLGCLIEKEKATPQNYPLTLNSLRLACNQSTNRSPVVDYDEATVDAVLLLLRQQGLIRNVYSPSNRATKYRHVLAEVWHLDAPSEAVIGVLLLRGAQTVGEVKGRTERLAHLPTLDDTEAVLMRLADRDDPLVLRLDRQPGQKDERWVHLLGSEEHAAALGSVVALGTGVPSATAASPGRLDALEAEVAALRAELDDLRAELATFRAEFG